MKVGAIFVPTSILLTVEQVFYLAKDAGAKVFVIDKVIWVKWLPDISQCADLTRVLLSGPGDVVEADSESTVKDLSERLAAI